MINKIKSFRRRKITIVIVLIVALAVIIPILYLIHNSSTALAAPSITKDPNLKVETLVTGLSSPTSMAFIDNNNILVLEKGGQVRLVLNGILQSRPVLQVPVDTESERGLLGIAIMNSTKSGNAATTANNNNNKFVFLYYTESKDGQLRNRVYRYNWDEQKQSLVNPTLILDLPALPGPNHDGGKLIIGPDHYLYAVIGDLNHRGKLQNIKNGPDPDDTSVIFRIDPNDGSAAKDNPFVSNNNNANTAMRKYYAYGVRNSFGITFDPITGDIWDTENGEATYDEVNLVKPGFNSGWYQVMGPMSRSNVTERNLVNFRGSHYSDPIFSWYNCIGVTGIEFLKSSKLGQKYMNNIFVGDINNGHLYYFELNKTRTGFRFDPNTQSALTDHVADNKDEVSEITFGTGFGGITDIKTGPDGYLYILSYGNGCLYRIGPAQQ